MRGDDVVNQFTVAQSVDDTLLFLDSKLKKSFVLLLIECIFAVERNNFVLLLTDAASCMLACGKTLKGLQP